MANPVVDVVAGVAPGRRTLRILPVYPASAKAGLTSWEIGEFVAEALTPRRGIRRPAPRRVAVRARPVGADRSLRGHPRTRVGRRGRAGATPPRLRRALPPPTRARVAPPRLRGQRPRPASRRVAAGGDGVGRRHAGGAVPERVALRADHGAAPGPRRHRGRHGRPVPDAPPAAGRRRLGQDGGGAGGAARRSAERAPGCADGADRGAGRAALRGGARPARRPRRPGWHGGGRGPRRTPHEPGQGQGAHGRARGPGVGSGEHRGRHPRAVDRGGGLRVARRGGDRRAAPLRRRAAGHAARQGHRRRPGPARHDGDADPAHGGHGDLRRSRPDHARRAATGPPAGHDRMAPGERARGGAARLGPRPRRRWRPGTGPSSYARWSATRCASRRSRPPRNSSASPRASWRGCRSGCSTGRWRPPPARR